MATDRQPKEKDGYEIVTGASGGGKGVNILILVLVVICAFLFYRTVALKVRLDVEKERLDVEKEHELDRAFAVLATGNAEERGLAIAIIKERVPEAFDRLVGMLETLGDPSHRHEVIFLLGETGHEGAIEPIAREMARGDIQTYSDCVAALRKIAGSQPPEVVKVITDDVFVKSLRAGSLDPEGIFDYLAVNGDASHTAAIVPYIDGGVSKVKAVLALVAISRRAGPGGVAVDAKYLADEMTPVRLGAAEIFAINRDERGVETLIALMALEGVGEDGKPPDVSYAYDAALALKRTYGKTFGYDVLKPYEDNKPAVTAAKKWFEENRGRVFVDD